MTRIVVAADGRPAKGLGHLARCTALAAALREAGAPPALLALGAPEPLVVDGERWTPADSPEGEGAAVLVLDTYDAATDVPAGPALVVFSDRDEPRPGAALAVRTAGRERPGRLYGLRYACLRRPYWDAAPGGREHPDAVGRVLVTTGGTDPGGVGARVASELAAALPSARIGLVRGAAAPPVAVPGVETVRGSLDLSEELAAADLVVSGAGQTAMEAAALGRPCVAVVLVDNQRAQAAALADAGAAVVVEPGEAVSATVSLAAERAERAALGARAAATIDGQGARRVAERVVELAGRRAT
ncbi:MAG TPA: glycosyltransferase [Capillimicrobium sp.]|jgi:spore coat polysaccharide biosynthesis predicted glycosyltransferase SpsG